MLVLDLKSGLKKKNIMQTPLVWPSKLHDNKPSRVNSPRKRMMVIRSLSTNPKVIIWVKLVSVTSSITHTRQAAFSSNPSPFSHIDPSDLLCIPKPSDPVRLRYRHPRPKPRMWATRAPGQPCPRIRVHGEIACLKRSLGFLRQGNCQGSNVSNKRQAR